MEIIHSEELRLSNKKIDWKAIENKYFMKTFKRFPVTLVDGRASRVWDDKGKEYLDFFGGLAVNSLGHCHPVVVKALIHQAKTLMQTTCLYYTIPQLQIAKLLIDNSCFDRIFFSNSGTEANEGAVKLARKYGKLYLKGAYKVITANNSFHGRTLAMVAATGQKKFQEPYTPLPDGFINVPFNDINSIKKATDENTCAVMLEVVQGEGGVNMADKQYLSAVRKWCDDKGILLIFDEVQTGIGRLGTLFGYQYFNVEPDIITLAKGMGGGVPIGAFMAKEKAAVFALGDHGTTFGGNPLMCAVSYAVVDYIIRNNIPTKVDKLGLYFKRKLDKLKKKYNFIKMARGCGLLVALEFNSDISEKVTLECLEHGLLVNSVKPNIIRFVPPLIITEKDIDSAISILDNVLVLHKSNK